MNTREFAAFTSAIKTLWPRDTVIPNREAMDLWYRNLEDIPKEIAEKALDYWVQTSQFPPTIAEIRRCAATICSGKQPDWGEGWQKVLDAIHLYGYMQQDAAYESFDEITKQAVKRLGWQNLCCSDNQAADRANFRMIYEELQGKARRHIQLSPELRSYIDGIAAPITDGSEDRSDTKNGENAGEEARRRMLYQPKYLSDDPGCERRRGQGSQEGHE